MRRRINNMSVVRASGGEILCQNIQGSATIAHRLHRQRQSMSVAVHVSGETGGALTQ